MNQRTSTPKTSENEFVTEVMRGRGMLPTAVRRYTLHTLPADEPVAAAEVAEQLARDGKLFEAFVRVLYARQTTVAGRERLAAELTRRRLADHVADAA